jgi:nitrogen fixation protein NifU and related proteins
MIYEQDWLDRFKQPSYAGELEDGVSAQSSNDTCGDRIKISVIEKDGVIEKVRFVSTGCVMSSASADLLCEEVEGKDFEAMVSIKDDEWISRFKNLSPGRYNCVLLALKALREVKNGSK